VVFGKNGALPASLELVRVSDMTYLSGRQYQRFAKLQPYKWTSALFTYRNIAWLAAVVDVAFICAASIVGGLAYHGFSRQSAGGVLLLAAIGANSGLIFVLLTQATGLYSASALMAARKQLASTSFNLILALLIVTSFLFVLKTGQAHSQGALIAFGLLAHLLLMSWRVIIGGALREAIGGGTLSGPKALVVGDPEHLAMLSCEHLLRRFGIREIGRVTFSNQTDQPAHDLGILDTAIRLAQQVSAEQVLLAVGWDDHRRIVAIVRKLQILAVSIYLLPDRYVESVFRMVPERDSSILIELQRAPLSRAEWMAKRIFDVVCAGTILVFVIPILAAASVAILVDSGRPVVFRQRRIGFNGRPFEIVKFRTMHVLEDGCVIRQVKRNDARVTRIGRFLRSTSIDELPQLINVLRGEMSLVGPRPHAIAHDNEFTTRIDNYAFRHRVKPGITGLAQVQGLRGETPNLRLIESRLDMDLWYINNWNFWLDLWILMRTVVTVCFQRNAY
jgi:undecaprenyl-phosphate galactose phosphotransferase/putative colanic acid biosynthesis UDP-glucose lipid carrier transferase